MLAVLLRALESRSNLVRTVGLMLLSCCGPNAVPVETLLRLLLNDPSTYVRLVAISMLQQSRGPIEISRFCKALGDSSILVATLCAQTLARDGDQSAVPHLVEALSKQVRDARPSAVDERWRAWISDPSALSEERQGFIRALVAGLHKMCDSRALPVLVRTLQVDDEQIQADALRALHRIRSAYPESDLGPKQELVRAIGPLRSFPSWPEARALLHEIESRPDISFPVPAMSPETDATLLPVVGEPPR